MSANGELIKAGRIPATVIGAWEYTHMAICRKGSPEEAAQARRAVYRHRLQRYTPREKDRDYWERRDVAPLTLDEMNDCLDALGLGRLR